MYSKETIGGVMKTVAKKADESKDLFSELDGLSGDGDLGETVGQLYKAICKTVDEVQVANVGELCMKTGMAMNKAAPSTLGTLLSSGVMAMAKAFKGMETLSDADVAKIPGIIAGAIMEKGKAKQGDKTILDALIPFAETLEKEFNDGVALKDAYKKGAAAAIEGAASTAGMVPKAGRAQWIGERVKDNLDGGAMLCSKIAELFI